MENNNSFEYTYSAQQQKEVEAIRRKYLPKQEDKMEKLRKLHSIPTRRAQAASITLGTIGALILGSGMSLCMTVLGSFLGEYGMGVGIVVGVIGIVLVAMAYPLYTHTLKKERSRIAPEILKLADELMK